MTDRSNRYNDVKSKRQFQPDHLNKEEHKQMLFDSKSKTRFHSHLLSREETRAANLQDKAERSKLLLQEESGYIEDNDIDDISQLTQHQIQDAVDIASAQKFFELDLNQFGPYRCNYTRNGRFLCLGGRKGHVAAIDWQTKRLLCEINVMERLNDIRWLHQETMLAVAQKQWTYIYDNQGVELHCLKNLDCVLRLEFLPYHFLLVSASSKSYLSYLDVSVGKSVAGFNTHMGRLDVMTQNPANAIVHLGHSSGTVTLWSPNIKEPLVKMLCHGSGVRSIAVDKTGRYMATSGIDRSMRVWDLRTYKLFNSYKIREGASCLAFSQTGYLAAGIGSAIEVYEKITESVIDRPYLTHRLTAPVTNLQFCPYEDVLGVGHTKGFSSLIVPGSGEPNFDATESNPYQTKKQRREMEVRQLLEKIQPDMITLDTCKLGQIEKTTAEEIMQQKEKQISYNKQKIKFTPKHKAKGASKPSKVQGRIQSMQDLQDRKLRKRKADKVRRDDEKRAQEKTEFSVFDRFKRKDT